MTRYHMPSTRLPLQKLCVSDLLCKIGFIITCTFLISVTTACEEEVPLPMQITDAEPPKQRVPDADPLPEVPLSAPEIFKNLPYPPSQILRKPGDAVGGLRRQLPNLQSIYSSRFLAESRQDAPFKSVVYQLDKRLRRIEAVVATFHDEYVHNTRYNQLHESISSHLGKGIKFNERHWKGMRWNNLDYRIELRKDKATQDVELLFHKRGAETLDRTKKGIPKSILKK